MYEQRRANKIEDDLESFYKISGALNDSRHA